jgi:hypothetical protein
LLEVTANLPTATATALDRHYQALHPFFVAVTSDFVEALPRRRPGRQRLDAQRRRRHRGHARCLGVDALITDRLSAALDLVARRAQESGPEGEWRAHSAVMNNERS